MGRGYPSLVLAAGIAAWSGVTPVGAWGTVQPVPGYDALATRAHALGPGVGLLIAADGIGAGVQVGGARGRATGDAMQEDGAMVGLLEGTWREGGDRLECRLERGLAGGGRARFVRAAGVAQYFVLLVPGRVAAGAAEVIVELPPWHRDYPSDSRIGSLRLGGDTAAVPASGAMRQASVRDAGLIAGMLAALQDDKVVSVSPDADAARVIRIGAGNFKRAYADYRRCLVRLSPVGFAQVQRTVVHFAVDRATLDARAVRLLDRVAKYSRLDARVGELVVDGHTDRTGSLEHNETLSAARATAAARYLTAHGVARERLAQRAHAYRWPVASNRTPEGRGRNRRATVRLVRGSATGQHGRAGAPTVHKGAVAKTDRTGSPAADTTDPVRADGPATAGATAPAPAARNTPP